VEIGIIFFYFLQYGLISTDNLISQLLIEY